MNIRLILAALLLGATLQANAQRLTVEHQTVDCGSVPYFKPVTATFELRNKGSRRLKISQVRTSCGCTNVEYPQGDIAGGERFTLKLTYDARQLGHFHKEAAIYSNGSKEPIYLVMRGVVLAEVEDYTGSYPYKLGNIMADKAELEFDDVNKGDMPEAELYIRNAGTTTLHPNMLHLPAYLSASVTPEELRPGQAGRVVLTLYSDKLRDYGLTQTSIYLAGELGEKVSADKEITVSAVLLPDMDMYRGAASEYAPKMVLSADSLTIDFGGKAKKRANITITNQGRTTLEISSLQMFTQGLSVTLGKRKLAAGESTTMRITAYRDQLAKVSSIPRVLMITNDPKLPKVVVKVKTKN